MTLQHDMLEHRVNRNMPNAVLVLPFTHKKRNILDVTERHFADLVHPHSGVQGDKNQWIEVEFFLA